MAILKCSCTHKAQDEFHGPGMRVCNKVGKKGTVNEYKCTVCGCPHTGTKAATEAEPAAKAAKPAKK